MKKPLTFVLALTMMLGVYSHSVSLAGQSVSSTETKPTKSAPKLITIPNHRQKATRFIAPSSDFPFDIATSEKTITRFRKPQPGNDEVYLLRPFTKCYFANNQSVSNKNGHMS